MDRSRLKQALVVGWAAACVLGAVFACGFALVMGGALGELPWGTSSGEQLWLTAQALFAWLVAGLAIAAARHKMTRWHPLAASLVGAPIWMMLVAAG